MKNCAQWFLRLLQRHAAQIYGSIFLFIFIACCIPVSNAAAAVAAAKLKGSWAFSGVINAKSSQIEGFSTDEKATSALRKAWPENSPVLIFKNENSGTFGIEKEIYEFTYTLDNDILKMKFSHASEFVTEIDIKNNVLTIFQFREILSKPVDLVFTKLPESATSSSEPRINPEYQNIYFRSDNYSLDDYALKVLKSIITKFKDGGYRSIRIEGHTDNTGDESANVVLSDMRVFAVRNFLVANEIPADRIATFHYGSFKSQFDNRTAEGRSMNRRVNIELIPSNAANVPSIEGIWIFETVVNTPVEKITRYNNALHEQLGWPSDLSDIIFAYDVYMRAKTAILNQNRNMITKNEMIKMKYTIDRNKISFTNANGDKLVCTYELKDNELILNGFPEKIFNIKLKRR